MRLVSKFGDRAVANVALPVRALDCPESHAMALSPVDLGRGSLNPHRNPLCHCCC